jgi:peptide/nickel transport system permease protein
MVALLVEIETDLQIQAFEAELAPQSLARRTRQRVATAVRYHKPAVAGVLMLVAIVLIALLAPVLPVTNPDTIDAKNYLKGIGTSGHVLGVDSLGRDVLSRMIWGARSAIIIAIVPITIATLIGLMLGALAGFMGRLIEIIIMRVLDVFFGLPAVLLAVLVGVTLGPGLWNMIWAITIVIVPPMARVTYTAVVVVREQSYIEAARAVGARNRQIVINHIVPNVLAPVLAYSASLAGLIVVLGAGLSLIGLGVQGTTADWGKMIGEGRTTILVAPHVSTLPGLGIFWLAIGFNLVADQMRDALDPRLRS